MTLEHNNVFQDGVEGILADLDSALDLPEELYISNEYQMSFDETGDGHIHLRFSYMEETTMVRPGPIWWITAEAGT